MNKMEFKNAFDRICEYYGKEEFILNNGIRDIYFQEMQYIVPERWKKVEQLIFKKHKFMPKVAEISDIVKEVGVEKKVVEHTKCDICGGIGYVIIYKKQEDMKGYYAYKCICNNAPAYNGREIKDTKHRSDFYLPSIQELPEYEEIIKEGK